MQRHQILVAVSLMVATFLTAIEGTVVSTAMPKIASELHGVERMNWVFSIYLLTSAVTVPIFGKLSDLFGRKKIFYIGTFIFLIGSALCGLSSSMNQLIFYRALQGIGAGAIMPVTTTIVGDVFPIEHRAKIFGLISAIWGISGIVGPLVGGFLVDYWTWEWIFFLNIPFGIVSMILLAYSLQEKVEKTRKPIDFLGALTFSVSMIALLYALQVGGEEGWSSPLLLTLFVVFLFFFILFIYIETKVSEPMIPLHIFRHRIISVLNGISVITSAVLIGVMVYIPMWIQGVLGEGATLSGMVLMPMSITWTIGSFLVGRLVARGSSRQIILLSLCIILISCMSFVWITQNSPLALFYIISSLMGIGFGIFTSYSTMLVQSSVDQNLRGVSTSAIVFFRTLGQTVGVAILGTFFNASVNRQFSTTNASLELDQLNLLIHQESSISLPETIVILLREILVQVIHNIFFLLALLMVVMVLISMLLPKTKMISEKNR